ncbi:LysR family transcriptional regulator [Pseudomonas benzopyrenica]|uniref:LysR family transcriptional regulator n=1 Tax=Pseudomonas benzopyrenica TaxID=2993566 RepID=A0ABZ2FS19_9PSED
MSADDLAFFVRLAGHPSLTAAARELGLSLAAVSKRLSALERRLGVQLIRRTTRRLDLTPEGLRYLEGARPLLTQLEDLEAAVGRPDAPLSGALNLNATFGFGRRHLAPLLSDFARRHPQLELNLHLSSHPVNLLEGPFDLDIRVGEPPDARVIAHRLLDNRRLLCAAPAYLARAGVPESVADLARHNCLVLRQDAGDYAVWRFTKAGQHFAQKVRGSLSSNDGEVVVRLALEGHGLILRSEWDVAELIASGALVPVLTDHEAPAAAIYAVHRQQRHVPRRLSELIRHLAQELPARLGR